MEGRPPLRLSVEERVDQAVREAVRRALAEQRKTQEAELDALSDVLQRSGGVVGTLVPSTAVLQANIV